jgi:hypothetical protein
MGIATAIIVIGIIFTTAFGPEKRGRAFVGGPIGTNIHHDTEKAIDTASLDEKTSSVDQNEKV